MEGDGTIRLPRLSLSINGLALIEVKVKKIFSLLCMCLSVPLHVIFVKVFFCQPVSLGMVDLNLVTR